jgi:hypothetical protein
MKDRTRYKLTTGDTRRSIRGELLDRVIFNFRLPADDLARRLKPIGWSPQIRNGFGIVSFCILRLRNVNAAWLPKTLGTTTISCAYRVGIVDDARQPCVWIPGGRYSDKRLICWLAPHVLCDPFRHVVASLMNNSVNVSNFGGQPLFSAEMSDRTCNALRSEVFRSPEEFGDFIRGGIVSYSASTRLGFLTRVDLVKEETGYQPINATIYHSRLDEALRNGGFRFDSAFRTGGGEYLWTFRGLVPCKTLTQVEPFKLQDGQVSPNAIFNIPNTGRVQF